jgi:hypothetical protein
MTRTAQESLIARSRSPREESSNAGLIDWKIAQPGLWAGQIGLDFAGLVELTDDRFVVTDWRGERVGEYETLAAAERALEPAERARIRDEQERRATRASVVWTSAVSVSALVAATVIGAWLATAA